MRHKKLQASFLFIFLLFLVLFIGLAHRPHARDFDIGTVEWKEKEVFPGKWHGFSTYTTYQGIEYDFNSENFDEESARELIGKISDFISYTDSFFDSPTQDLTVYLGFQSDNNASFRTPLCITDGKTLTFDDLWCLVKKTHPGNPSCAEQYGLFFAYCIDNDILSYDNSDTHSNELQSFYSDKEHLYLLDFTLPMLETTYFSQEDSAIEKESVKAFSLWYVDSYSFDAYEKLCHSLEQSYDHESLVNEKNKWLKSIGCNSTYSELGKINFGYNHTDHAKDSCTYRIESDDAIWLWDDADVAAVGYLDMVKNYNIIEPLRVLDFQDARDYLDGYLPENLNKVYILTQFEKEHDVNTSRSCYFPDKETIKVVLGWYEVPYCLLHEYCHHLTYGPDKIVPTIQHPYLVEWFPTVMANIELENRESSIAYVSYLGKNLVRKRGYWDDKNDCYSGTLGTYRQALERYSQRFDSATGNLNVPAISDIGYSESASMAKYITDTYGFDKLVALSTANGDFEKILGTSFGQVYQDTMNCVSKQMDDYENLSGNIQAE